MTITAHTINKGTGEKVPCIVISFYSIFRRFFAVVLEGNGVCTHYNTIFLWDLRIDGVPIQDYKLSGV